MIADALSNHQKLGRKETPGIKKIIEYARKIC